jgi:hypothetical protein
MKEECRMRVWCLSLAIQAPTETMRPRYDAAEAGGRSET